MGKECSKEKNGHDGKHHKIKFPRDDEVKTAKVIIMGNQKVGKTSIIRAYMDSASQRNAAYVRTNTVNDFVKVIRVENDDGTITNLKLSIWDCAGDNNVHNLAHLFTQNV